MAKVYSSVAGSSSSNHKTQGLVGLFMVTCAAALFVSKTSLAKDVTTLVQVPTLESVSTLSTHGIAPGHQTIQLPIAISRHDYNSARSLSGSSQGVNVQSAKKQDSSLWWATITAGCWASALAFFWSLRRPRQPVLQPLLLPEPVWNMANVSVNPELLKRFGITPPEESAYPGLAESILERKAPGGVPANADNEAVGYSKEELATTLRMLYQAVNLDYPNMRVHSVDPPVLTIEGFLGDEECDALMKHTPSLLQPSTVGSGRLFAQGTELSQRRTSTSVLLDDSLLAARPSIAAPTDVLQSRAKMIFEGLSWDPRGKLPKPGNVCFEGLQVAHYEEGQYFLEHQDGFPLITAKKNQFQRLATILVYLNDVPQGGQTRFPYLDLSISPKKGTALVFFPGFVDGRPDDRLLHEACAAVSEKWVAQQWVAVGVAPGNTVRVPTAMLDATAAVAGSQKASEVAGDDVEEQRQRMKAKMEAMEAHNARAVALNEKSKKGSKKNSVEARLGPKKGFGN